MPGRSVTSGEPTREGFTGHELDAETGWNYAGARYLDPVIGRWMATDPLASLSPGLTPYHYVRNNPLSYTDPTGLIEVDCAGLRELGMGTFADNFVGDGSTGNWCTSDREENTDVWQSANDYNLRRGARGADEYTTIAQRRAFYQWFGQWALDEGHTVAWPAAAAWVLTPIVGLEADVSAGGLRGWFASSIAGYDEGVSAYANAVNEAIFSDMFQLLLDVYTADNLITGDAAVRWDHRAVEREQTLPSVLAIYRTLDQQTLQTVNAMATRGSWPYSAGISVGQPYPPALNGHIRDPNARITLGKAMVNILHGNRNTRVRALGTR